MNATVRKIGVLAIAIVTVVFVLYVSTLGLPVWVSFLVGVACGGFASYWCMVLLNWGK